MRKKTLADWDAKLLSPCGLVDRMWHQHILDVFNYHNDMVLLCGQLVGHNPDGALDFADKLRRDHFTRECLRRHFGSYDANIWDNHGLVITRAVDRVPNRAGSASLDELINIIIKDHNGERTIFKIKNSTRMSKVFNTFAQRKGVCVNTLRFIGDDGRISPDETAATLDLEEMDQITVYLEQGGC